MAKGDLAAMLCIVGTMAGCKAKPNEAEARPDPLDAAVSPPAVVAQIPSEADAEPAADDALDVPYKFLSELALGQGKPLPPPKVERAGSELLKQHQAALQTAFERIVKQGCKEESRFNASTVPATYVMCRLPASAEGQRINVVEETLNLLEVERDTVRFHAFSGDGQAVGDGMDDPAPWALWQTHRGYFVDLFGDGSGVFFLRRQGTLGSHGSECKARKVTPEAVTEVKDPPHYPNRGLDVDGDEKVDFPAAVLSIELPGWRLDGNSPIEGTCDLRDARSLGVYAVGPMTYENDAWTTARPSYRSYYERRLATTKAQVKAIAVWSGVTGDGGVPKEVTRRRATPAVTLRFQNACALDVAQTATELYANARILGATAEAAIAPVDQLMTGFALRPNACEGLHYAAGYSEVAVDAGRNTPGSDVDFWPQVRAALLAWAPPQIGDARGDAAAEPTEPPK